ncbi:hypothetical protein ACFSYB_13135 [Litchfieldia salsa]
MSQNKIVKIYFPKEVPKLNYVQLITSILNNVNFSNFGRKKKSNSGVIWASILGLIISLVAVGMKRKPEMMQPIQDMVGDLKEKRSNQSGNVFQSSPAFAEFAKEIQPNLDRDKTVE